LPSGKGGERASGYPCTCPPSVCVPCGGEEGGLGGCFWPWCERSVDAYTCQSVLVPWGGPLVENVKVPHAGVAVALWIAHAVHAAPLLGGTRSPMPYHVT